MKVDAPKLVPNDGHDRFVGGARAGQCKLKCVACQNLGHSSTSTHNQFVIDCQGCGETTDEKRVGESWIACDECTSWHHCRCVGKHTEEERRMPFVCEACSVHAITSPASNGEDDDVDSEVGTSKLLIEQLSGSAAAARKANRAWRFKPRRSQFRGVSWDQKAAHWRVEVRMPGGKVRINCGTWDDETDAARAYDREAKKYTGKELNFGGNDEEEEEEEGEQSMGGAEDADENEDDEKEGGGAADEKEGPSAGLATRSDNGKGKPQSYDTDGTKNLLTQTEEAEQLKAEVSELKARLEAEAKAKAQLQAQLKATREELNNTNESEENLKMICWAEGGLEEQCRIMKRVRCLSCYFITLRIHIYIF